MGLHAPQREELIKVDDKYQIQAVFDLEANRGTDSGYSLGQVTKFVGHRNSETLIGHYLSDMSNIDGTATFFGLEPRRDITGNFRSASKGTNPDLLRTLPASILSELEHRQDYIELSKQLKELPRQIKSTPPGEECYKPQAHLDNLYFQRRKLRDQLLYLDRLTYLWSPRIWPPDRLPWSKGSRNFSCSNGLPRRYRERASPWWKPIPRHVKDRWWDSLSSCLKPRNPHSLLQCINYSLSPLVP